MKLQALRQSLAGFPSSDMLVTTSVMFVVCLCFANALPTQSSMFAVFQNDMAMWCIFLEICVSKLKVQELESEETGQGSDFVTQQVFDTTRVTFVELKCQGNRMRFQPRRRRISRHHGATGDHRWKFEICDSLTCKKTSHLNARPVFRVKISLMVHEYGLIELLYLWVDSCIRGVWIFVSTTFSLLASMHIPFECVSRRHQAVASAISWSCPAFQSLRCPESRWTDRPPSFVWQFDAFRSSCFTRGDPKKEPLADIATQAAGVWSNLPLSSNLWVEAFEKHFGYSCWCRDESEVRIWMHE